MMMIWLSFLDQLKIFFCFFFLLAITVEIRQKTRTFLIPTDYNFVVSESVKPGPKAKQDREFQLSILDYTWSGSM